MIVSETGVEKKSRAGHLLFDSPFPFFFQFHLSGFQGSSSI